MGFVHLHNHTEYSCLSGACKIEKLVKRAKSVGQTAVAITDEFNLFGAVKFFDCCRKFGLKPIVGCEIVVFGSENSAVGFASRSFKIVVLCENAAGYENLVKIVSVANMLKQNEFAAVSFDFLAKNSSGLILLLGGLGCEVADAFFGGGFDQAKRVAMNYLKVFGRNCCFLELQNHGLEFEFRLNECFLKISKELNIELVATNNVYYVDRVDAKIQRILSCIRFSRLFNDSDFESLPNSEFYLKTELEMKNLFVGFEEAIENTEKIANRCCFEFSFGNVQVPKFEFSGKISNKHLLFCEAKKGLILKYGEKPSSVVLNRFIYEFKVVARMGFVDYFLIVQDYVDFARKNGIAVGPGRGSGAGSLLAFCLNITAVDPIKYGLSFERFLNPDRKKMPDFDVDFCNERRHEVLNYVIKKYGENCVAQIVTFGTLAAKAALRDVARIFGVEFEFADRLVKLIPNRVKVSLSDALNESDKLKMLIKTSSKARLIFENARLIEGYLKNTSTHAAAVVFAPNNLGTFVPLFKHENTLLTQYAMGDVAKLGFLKMDFLGLRNLTVIGKCEKLIQTRVDCNFKIETIDLNDEKTFKLLASGQSIGVFQLESVLTRTILTRFKPTKLEHLMIIMSLNRPGPSQFIDIFLNNTKLQSSEKNLFGVINFNPKIKKILEQTRGIILFQEQVMQIFRDVAGYSFGRTDLIRKAITEKNEELIAKEREVFLFGFRNSFGEVESVGAVNLGVELQEAEQIFRVLTKFSSYAFNKAHAAAYSLIAYRTAYLKANFVNIYMACLLNSVVVLNNKTKLQEYLNECARAKVKVLPLDINTSGVFFDVLKNGTLSFSLLAVKGVGMVLAQQIFDERKKRPFSSVEDFFSRMSCRNLSKFAVGCLVENGAFFELEKRNEVVLNLANKFSNSFFGKGTGASGQISLFSCGKNEKKLEEFVAKVVDFQKISNKTTGQNLILLKLFCGFRVVNCLVDGFFLKNLKFSFKLGVCFKFDCVEIGKDSKKIFKLEKIEKLSEVDAKKLVLVVKIKPNQVDRLNKLKCLFERFVGESSVFFALKLQNQLNLRYFKKQGLEKIKLNNVVLHALEKIFGEDCFKIEIKK